MAEPAMRHWRSSDGLMLFARDYAGTNGDTRLPVICLHGLTRNSLDFEDVAPWITGQGRRVLALDVRGRGRSARDPQPMNYVAPVYARDVLEMMDRLGIGRAVFLGTSMGGLITMMVAARRSKAVAAAILNDIGPSLDPAGIARIKSYAGKPMEIADWAGAQARIAHIMGPAFPHYGPADWSRLARRSFREGVDGRPVPDYDPAIVKPIQAGITGAQSLLAWLLFRRLARRRPVLLVHGGISDLITPPIVARMRRHAPGMDYVQVPDVGHAPELTEPAARNAIGAFLERVP